MDLDNMVWLPGYIIVMKINYIPVIIGFCNGSHIIWIYGSSIVSPTQIHVREICMVVAVVVHLSFLLPAHHSTYKHCTCVWSITHGGGHIRESLHFSALTFAETARNTSLISRPSQLFNIACEKQKAWYLNMINLILLDLHAISGRQEQTHSNPYQCEEGSYL